MANIGDGETYRIQKCEINLLITVPLLDDGVLESKWKQDVKLHFLN